MRTGYKKKLAQLLLAIHGLPRAKDRGAEAIARFVYAMPKWKHFFPISLPFSLSTPTNQKKKRGREGEGKRSMLDKF